MPRRRPSGHVPESIHLSLDISLDELARQVAVSMSREDALAFVKAIDEEFGEWDFTLALCTHFDKLKLDWERENAEDTKKARTAPAEHANAVFCEHANEVPLSCRCPADCYCKTHTCKNLGKPEPWRHGR